MHPAVDMKAIIFALFSMAMLVSSAVAQEKSPEEVYRLPQDAVDALSSGSEFVLYSLDPGPITFQPQHLKPEEDFYGSKKLGQLALTNPKTRMVAVGAVIDAIQHKDYHHIAGCFFPRHVLRVTAKERVFDFVICYQCGQIRLFEKGAFVAEIGIPSAPETLNKLLSDAGVPLAEPPRR